MKTCGAYHPDDMAVTCALDPHPHPVHIGGFPLQEWPSEDYVAPIRIRSRNRDDEMKDYMAQVAAEVPSERVYSEESPFTDL